MYQLSTYQQLLAASGIALIISSLLIFFLSKRASLAVLLLLCGAMLVRLFYAGLDPFLNVWDEQYHALVAKNMLLHPFVPTLYENPVLPYFAGNWVGEHVWLHKQPLFLWQIAISYKMFGVSELAARIPSVIMSGLVVCLIYRMGKISLNERAGFFAAFFYTAAYYSLDLITGRVPTDHNDIAFHFYIAASIWSWMEYSVSRKWKWIVLAGLFSGCAVLVKWLTGLLIFSGWGISIITDPSSRKNVRSYLHIAAAFIIALAVFVPWQLYIIHAFPAESAASYAQNAMHLTSVVEEHGGDALFYFHNLRTLYGNGQLVPWLIIAMLIFFMCRIKSRPVRAAFITFVAIVYLFFSLAATKMVSFCYIVSPFVFLAFGNAADALIVFLQSKLKPAWITRALTILVAAGVAFFCFDSGRFKRQYMTKGNDYDAYFSDYQKDIEVLKKLHEILPPGVVVMNLKKGQNISAMFYNDCIAYDRVPTEQEIALVREAGYTIAIFDNGMLPKYITDDPLIIKLGLDYYRKKAIES